MNAAVWIFLQACVCGASSGLLFDLFRLFRLVFPPGRRAVFWQDGIYFLCISAWIFRFTLRLTSGQLRLFVLIGWLLGFILWYCTAGSLIYGFCKSLAGFFRRIIGAISRKKARVFRRFQVKKDPPLGHSA